jgi:hypothetical protein
MTKRDSSFRANDEKWEFLLAKVQFKTDSVVSWSLLLSVHLFQRLLFDWKSELAAQPT